MVVGLLALAMIFSFGCTKKPKSPEVSGPPQTSSTSYKINIAPDSASLYGVTVWWRASEDAGESESYRYWVDSGDTSYTFDASVLVRMNFTPTDTIHTFSVEARDTYGNWDTSPAVVSINFMLSRDFNVFGPNTFGVTVPPPGALTSRGLKLVASATSPHRFVDRFQWAINDTAIWHTLPASLILPTGSTLEMVLDTTAVSLGPNIVYIRAMDDFDYVDSSPLTISFVAVDSLRPDLTIVSGPIPHAFYFLPSGSTTTDLAAAWFGDAAWYFSTLTYRYAVDDTANWSAWTDATSATLTELTAGPHQFTVEAMDLAGNTSIFQTDFGIGQLTGDRGILVVNGIDWSQYGGEMTPMYEDRVPFGSHPFHFWDFFPVDHSTYPAVLDSFFVGTGVIPGDSLGHYSSVIMLLNNYANTAPSDLDIYTTMFPLIMSYLNAGGNVALGCRFGASFIYGDLLTYGLSGDTLVFNNIGVNPTVLVAVAPGLVDIPRFSSSSLTDLLETPLPVGVTNLFDVANYPGSSGGILIEPANGGKFVFIAGRSYRFDHAAQVTDYDYILTNYFGEH